LAKNLRLTDTVTIASSGTTSTTLTLENNRIPLAIILPAALSGTSVKFQASNDNATFTPMYYESTEINIGVGTSRHVALNRDQFEAVKYLKLVSTSTETAARTITVISGE
jgi:hypothetical protein